MMAEIMAKVVVIGGGIAGLAAAHHLGQSVGGGGATPFRLVESSPLWGGKIISERHGDFLVEGGPDSFIPQKPQALELVRALGLSESLIPSNDARRGSFVLHRGRLVPLPEGLTTLVPTRWGAFLRSPLLSWHGKLRVLGERFVPARRKDVDRDESVADFVRRRLGSEALEGLAEPLLAHIHVADIERMSLHATYPRLAELERRHGGLFSGLQAAKVRPGVTGAPGGNPLFWSLRGGLGELVDALVGHLDPSSLVLGRRVQRLRRNQGLGFQVDLDDGTSLDASAVVLAVPAFAASELLRDLEPELAVDLGKIRYVSMATLSLGFSRSEFKHPLDGFGFFVPRREKRRVLACTWTSSKFASRSSENTALLRVFLGGAHGEEDLDLDDDRLIREVTEEIQSILRTNAEPVLARLNRWPRGYPQYDVGHLERLQQAEEQLPPGLFLAGSAFHGVGLPDCIKSGMRAAEQIQEHLLRSRG
jgi:oxygen-dependent protoporphyrinogen oxidase